MKKHTFTARFFFVIYGPKFVIKRTGKTQHAYASRFWKIVCSAKPTATAKQNRIFVEESWNGEKKHVIISGRSDDMWLYPRSYPSDDKERSLSLGYPNDLWMLSKGLSGTVVLVLIKYSRWRFKDWIEDQHLLFEATTAKPGRSDDSTSRGQSTKLASSRSSQSSKSMSKSKKQAAASESTRSKKKLSVSPLIAAGTPKDAPASKLQDVSSQKLLLCFFWIHFGVCLESSKYQSRSRLSYISMANFVSSCVILNFNAEYYF